VGLNGRQKAMKGMSETEERIAGIHRRVEELDELLAKNIAYTPADNPSTQNFEAMQFFNDRREERRLLLAELEELLKNEK
jgi:hypothetical protein